MSLTPSPGALSASLRRIGVALPSVATATAVGVIGYLGWVEVDTVARQRSAERQVVQATDLQNRISRLDELLTVLAQAGAQTGDRRWAERFEEIGPKLDDAVAEAVALATPSARDVLASTAGEAHRDLLTIERRALTLAEAGGHDVAQALLASPEFDYLESVYTSGLEVFGADLKARTAAQAEALSDRTWMQAAGLGLSGILLAGAAFGSRARARLRRAHERTEAMARTDTLTDLPNRRRLCEVLGERLAEGDVALLMLGLDRFKDLNGAHGQTAGDRLLQLVAVRLRRALGPDDLVVRLGGDEFAVMLHPGRSAQGVSREMVAQVGERLAAALDDPFEVATGVNVRLAASIGAVLAPSGQAPDDALGDAATALGRAKVETRGGLRFFEPGMDAEVRARAQLEAELRQAVMDDLIVPHFQPLVDLATGRLTGVEMLARWPHPRRGMVSPAEFIPVAEATGLIAPMTERLMRRACRVAADWPDRMVLACNVSPVQLSDPGFPATVRAILDETGLPPHRLELEVTESALVGDIHLARGLLDQLRALGVGLALDDFGTGYSSLRHLQMLPFDKLKVDASFVGAMAGNAESAKIVSAIVSLGHSLGLVTVGEGIETPEMARSLRAIGCDLGQGWHYGRPGPADSIEALLVAEQVDRGAVDATLAA